MAGTTVATALSTLLGGLSNKQLFALGGHLTSSNEAKAMGYLAAMAANPGGAGAFIGALATIPNLPPQVMTYVSAGIANPATFSENIANAEAALQTAMTNSGVLGQLGL